MPLRLVIITYIPPLISTAQHEALCWALDVEIVEARVSYGDPIIIVGGYFNRRDVMGDIDGADGFDVVITKPSSLGCLRSRPPWLGLVAPFTGTGCWRHDSGTWKCHSNTEKWSTEQPWITKSIKRLWKRKVRLNKRGWYQKWLDTDARLQSELQESRKSFLKIMLEEGNLETGLEGIWHLYWQYWQWGLPQGPSLLWGNCQLWRPWTWICWATKGAWGTWGVWHSALGSAAQTQWPLGEAAPKAVSLAAFCTELLLNC